MKEVELWAWWEELEQEMPPKKSDGGPWGRAQALLPTQEGAPCTEKPLW